MAKIREYQGEGIVVRYDVLRCIHAAECVKGLPAVFDPQRRPWIDATAGEAHDIAAVVARCPTGALQFERTDGVGEAVPREVSIDVVADGPLMVHGEIEVVDHNGEVVCRDTRIALCRCGASSNKPFCDNSHTRVGFRSGSA